MAIVPRIIGFSPGADGTPRDLQSLAEAAASGGIEALVLREPQLSERELVTLARSLTPWLQGGLILHAKHPAAVSIAQASGWGLHLPSTRAPSLFRDQVSGLLGISCHSIADLQAAEKAGCDYATLSPIFAPTSKPGDMREALGIDALQDAVHAVQLPVIALGGMTPDRARLCWDCGAHGVASLGLLFGPHSTPEDTGFAARALRAAMPVG